MIDEGSNMRPVLSESRRVLFKLLKKPDKASENLAEG